MLEKLRDEPIVQCDFVWGDVQTITATVIFDDQLGLRASKRLLLICMRCEFCVEQGIEFSCAGI